MQGCEEPIAAFTVETIGAYAGAQTKKDIFAGASFFDMDAVKFDYTCVTSENNIEKNTLTIGGPIFIMNTPEPVPIYIGNALDRLTAVTYHAYTNWCKGRVHMRSTRALSSCAAVMAQR